MQLVRPHFGRGRRAGRSGSDDTRRAVAERCEPRVLLAATVVADLNTAPAGSDPQWVTDVNGTAFFAATTPGASTELWKSDGTAAGTVLVKDMAPGSAGSRPSSLVNLDGTLLFIAYGTDSKPRLWRSDGTTAGTVPVSTTVTVDVANGPDYDLVVHRGAAYFRGSADDGSGLELWRTDGTAAGTFRVKDIDPGPAGSNPGRFLSIGQNLFFVANDGTHGAELWATDGTEAGTRLVKDTQPGDAPLSSNHFTSAGGLLYFDVSNGFVHTALWRSDGTDAGTFPIVTSDGYVTPSEAGGKLFFLLQYSQRDNGAWSSDGTAAGTVKLKALAPNSDMRLSPVSVGGAAYWGDYPSWPPQGGDSEELWRSDGTVAGTSRVETLAPFVLKGAAGGRLYFVQDQYSADARLWSTDGTPGNAAPVATVAPDATSDWNHSFADVGGTAFFDGTSPDAGAELWRSDGTPAGTFRVRDLNSSTVGSNVHDLADADGTLYFAADDYGSSTLYKTDAGGGTGVTSIGPPDATFSWLGVENMVGSGSLVYGMTIDNVGPPLGPYLFRTDGTRAGTVRVSDNILSGSIIDLDGKGTVLFSGANFADPLNSGAELWRTSGTPQGTALVKDINPHGPSSADPFANLNGVVLLAADDGTSGRELWRSDGTRDGTFLVKDIVPGPTGSSPHPVAVANGIAYFRVTAAGGTTELWKSDGTEAGTVRVAAVGDIYYPVGYPYHDGTDKFGAAIGGVVFFAAPDASGDQELWRSDGTEAGTYRLKDIEPGPAGSFPASFAAYGGKVYFSASDHVDGRELWVTDGTADGTKRVADLMPGPGDSNPQWLTASGGALWFAAESPLYGTELWKFTEDVVSPVTVTGRRLFYNNSVYDGRDPAGNAQDFGAVASDKAALLPGQGPATFANVSSYSKGINGVLLQFFDFSHLPMRLTADDLEVRAGTAGDPDQWPLAAPPAAVTIIPVPGPNLVWSVTWADGAIRNTWLRVTVKANADTRLAAPDVFYFGNLVGETGDATAGPGRPLAVTATDVRRARAAIGRTDAESLGRYDFNRDGVVNVIDLAVVKANLGRSLAALMAPAAEAGVATPTTVEGQPRSAPSRRRAWDEVDGAVAG